MVAIRLIAILDFEIESEQQDSWENQHLPSVCPKVYDRLGDIALHNIRYPKALELIISSLRWYF